MDIRLRPRDQFHIAELCFPEGCPVRYILLHLIRHDDAGAVSQAVPDALLRFHILCIHQLRGVGHHLHGIRPERILKLCLKFVNVRIVFDIQDEFRCFPESLGNLISGYVGRVILYKLLRYPVR